MGEHRAAACPLRASGLRAGVSLDPHFAQARILAYLLLGSLSGKHSDEF